MAGAPWFHVGDRSLLFFFESEKKHWPLWGGVSPIVRDVVIGQKAYTIEETVKLDEVIADINRFASEGRGR